MTRLLPWRVLALVALAVALAALVRFARLGADLPLEVETTNAPALDAFWYLQAASSWADGVKTEPAPTYDLEPWVTVGRAWFLVFGAGFAQECALGAFVGVLTVVLVFFAARPLGDRAAGLSALLAAVAFPFAEQSRSPLIYGFVAFVLTASAALYVRGTRRSRVAAWAIALAAPFFLKAPAAAVLLGVSLAQVLRSRARAGTALVIVLAAVAIGASLVLLDPMSIWTLTRQRLGNYVGPFDAATLAARALRLGTRPDFDAAEAANGPGIALLSQGPLLLAALGVAWAWRDLRRTSGAERDALAIALGTVVFFALAASPFTYRPIRYFIPVFPAALVLAGHALSRLLGPDATEAPPPSRAWAVATIVLGAVYGAWVGVHVFDLGMAFFVPWRTLSLEVTAATAFVGSAIVVVGIVAKVGLPRRALRLVAIALACVCVLDGLRDMKAAAHPEWTTVKARALVTRVLGPRAVLAGPYSTALACGTHIERRLGATVSPSETAAPASLALTLQGRGYTHFAADVEQAFRAQLQPRLSVAGKPLHYVAVVYVRHEPIMIFRFDWAEELGYELTPFERARALEEREGAEKAQGLYEQAGLADEEDLVLARVRSMVHSGKWEDAKFAAVRARERNPQSRTVFKLAEDMEHLVPVAKAAAIDSATVTSAH